MPVNIEKGGIYTAEKVRTGTSQAGKDWAMISVKAEKGHKRVTLWPVGKINFDTGDTFKVDEILSVSLKARKDQTGEWRDEVNVNCKVHAEARPEPEPSSTTFREISGDEDELPF